MVSVPARSRLAREEYPTHPTMVPTPTHLPTYPYPTHPGTTPADVRRAGYCGDTAAVGWRTVWLFTRLTCAFSAGLRLSTRIVCPR